MVILRYGAIFTVITRFLKVKTFLINLKFKVNWRHLKVLLWDMTITIEFIAFSSPHLDQAGQKLQSWRYVLGSFNNPKLGHECLCEWIPVKPQTAIKKKKVQVNTFLRQVLTFSQEKTLISLLPRQHMPLVSHVTFRLLSKCLIRLSTQPTTQALSPQRL